MASFPEGFLWGATVSAHQVEGGNYANDWWRWEQRPGRIRDGSNSQVAADHFQRFAADLELARKLGLRSLFLSVEWSRIQPDSESFDEAAIAHYTGVLDAMIARDIEPVCVLHHAANPGWFGERRGWLNPKAPEFFACYAARMAAVLGSKCRWWIPLYEPMHTLRKAYLEGQWPPGLRNPIAAIARALPHMQRAHDAAYDAIHAQRPDAMVGVALRGAAGTPEDPDRSWDWRAAQIQTAWPTVFLNSLGRLVTEGLRPRRAARGARVRPLDFLGVSYYGKQMVRFSPLRLPQLFVERTHLDMEPAAAELHNSCATAFRDVLSAMAGYNLPILITGNGVATEDDRQRCSYLLDHVSVVQRCLEEGVDVRGYFHRAFLDGFEWTRGYSARYGLVHVTRETLARTPNPSAYLYKEICETNAVNSGAIARFRSMSGEVRAER